MKLMGSNFKGHMGPILKIDHISVRTQYASKIAYFYYLASVLRLRPSEDKDNVIHSIKSLLKVRE